VESHTGGALLRLAADRFSLTGRLRAALDSVRSWDTHAPGVVVRDLAVVMALGGRAISDIETLRHRHRQAVGQGGVGADGVAHAGGDRR